VRRARLLLALAATASACAYLRAPRVPMPIERYAGGPETPRLLLLLPGRGDTSGDFARHGFVQMAREAGITADIAAADAHLGYYFNRSVADRLEADLFALPESRRYRETFVAGISLGGLGAMILAREYPARVQGILAIAPYLGPDSLLAQIETAGGLAAWSPGSGDFEGLWSWLKGYATGADRPPLYLAYGESDRYARGHRLLARSLPKERVFTEPGGHHDWKTWQKLWVRAVRSPGGVPGLATGYTSPR
jgi:pimeloyl-ACP methyl ester carboxylesterase